VGTRPGTFPAAQLYDRWRDEGRAQPSSTAGRRIVSQPWCDGPPFLRCPDR
jgi:hypothetical protein